MRVSLWLGCIADVADWCSACLLEPPRTFPGGMFPTTWILSPYCSWHGVVLSWCGTLPLLNYCICCQANSSSLLRSLYMAALPCLWCIGCHTLFHVIHKPRWGVFLLIVQVVDQDVGSIHPMISLWEHCLELALGYMLSHCWAWQSRWLFIYIFSIIPQI